MKNLKWLLLSLLFPLAAQANTARVCYENVCRDVEVGPVAKPFAQDLANPPTPAAKPAVADLKFWLLTGANIGLSVARTKSLVRCRADHGIGPCTDGGYGEFKAREIIQQGATAGSIILSYFHKRAEDRDGSSPKFWWIWQGGSIALNTGVIVTNASKHYGPKERD